MAYQGIELVSVLVCGQIKSIVTNLMLETITLHEIVLGSYSSILSERDFNGAKVV